MALSKRIREEAWRILREQGFTTFTARSASRDRSAFVDVVRLGRLVTFGVRVAGHPLPDDAGSFFAEYDSHSTIDQLHALLTETAPAWFSHFADLDQLVARMDRGEQQPGSSPPQARMRGTRCSPCYGFFNLSVPSGFFTRLPAWWTQSSIFPSASKSFATVTCTLRESTICGAAQPESAGHPHPRSRSDLARLPSPHAPPYGARHRS